jgi:hypothetical protein
MPLELRNRLAKIWPVFAVDRENRPFFTPGLHPETSPYKSMVGSARHCRVIRS